MCRAGGPRCKGGGQKTQARAGTATTATIDRPAATGGVRSREDTDRLAREYRSDAKGWDGKPLDDQSRRLYALRDSGWTGPVDQDGYPDTTSENAAILRRMAKDRGETPTW